MYASVSRLTLAQAANLPARAEPVKSCGALLMIAKRLQLGEGMSPRTLTPGRAEASSMALAHAGGALGLLIYKGYI